MFIVLALSFSNSLDKSQGTTAESILLQKTRKSPKASSRKCQGQGLGSGFFIRTPGAKKIRRNTVQRVLQYIVDAATEMQGTCPLGGQAPTFQATVLTCKSSEVHPKRCTVADGGVRGSKSVHIKIKPVLKKPTVESMLQNGIWLYSRK